MISLKITSEFTPIITFAPAKTMEDSTAISAAEARNYSRIQDIAILFKLRLTLLVVISAVLGYFMGTSVADWTKLFALAIGGVLLTGGSNGMNQVLEKEWDRLMHRTLNRPVAAGRMQPREGLLISLLSGIAGIAILWIFINTASGVLGLLAFFMYVFIYTPMKRVSSLAVFIGAFPGAIPPMLGYVAATNTYGLEAGLLFAMQFMWQFPHFWAIAWIAHQDYTTAGFKLLPSDKGPTKYTAIQTIIYSLLLIPVGLLPYFTGMSGWVSLVIVFLANLFMISRCINLYRLMTVQAARKVMFGSYIYLPVVLLALLADKM